LPNGESCKFEADLAIQHEKFPMSLRGPAGVLHDIVVEPSIAGTASVGCCSSPAQRLFARAGFRWTMIEMTRELDGA